MDAPSTPIIRDYSVEEIARERFLTYGPGSLSAAELIAVLLRTGTREETALQVAERLLGEVGSLRDIALADVDTLAQVGGIGRVRAMEIQAAIELGKRLLVLGDGVRPAIQAPGDVAALLMTEMRHLPQEHFKVLILDTKNQVLRTPTITVGTVNASLIHPREVFRPAMAQPCVAVILAHNHPSGDPTPSREDLDVTKRLMEAGKVLGIDVLDHVIVGDGRFVSLKERGLM